MTDGPAETGAAVRTVLVDDHPVVRAGLRALLTAAGGIDVVAEADSGPAAVAAVREQEVDVVLMDLRLGDDAAMDGVAATRAVLALTDPPRVLILTTYDTDVDILRAVEAGAAGYLLKDAPPDRLVQAVHAAARGETVLAPVVAERLMSRLSSPRPELSARELEVLGLVADGLSNRVIAKRLVVSEATVKSHLVHIFTKLDVDSRTAAVAAARAAGLIR
ncbi:MAG TPA: response regulator transcription factor [Segeticoccus sp.]|uniref:response regulator transcription factor n=1 Tax=Segeticoccus sp. TaxID=2706531 RepID=UPI002D802B07|nr:response regulator transcription factor [Segeticoccus sp.]HET8602155.1 response regulator transcription factor [Segeticoccus sp.]